jgi:hypothetical protein
LTAIGAEEAGPGLAAELANGRRSCGGFAPAEFACASAAGGSRPWPPAAGFTREEMEQNPALPRSSPGPSAAGFAREGTGIDGRLPAGAAPAAVHGNLGGGRRQSWLPRRWSIGPGFVREREGGEKNEAFFSVTSGSAGNFSSPKPLKAGCGRLLQVHYGKAALGCGFSHGRGPLVGLQAFGESHNRRKSNQRHPKAALKAGSFHPT